MGRLTAASLRRIVGRSGYEMIDTFVETGTANGELTEIVAVEFDRVHAIELDPVHVAMTKQRLVERVERVGKCEHVTVYTGDSREVLRLQLVESYASVLKNGLELLNIPALERM